MSNEVTEIKIDVEVLKQKIDNIMMLCNKMDAVIEKLVDNHDRIVNQIYEDMEKRKQDTVTDIKELHSRITTVDRNLTDKLELTERRIMDEIKSLRATIDAHNKKEDEDIKKLFQWRWMVAGGIIVVVWIISNSAFITKLLGN